MLEAFHATISKQIMIAVIKYLNITVLLSTFSLPMSDFDTHFIISGKITVFVVNGITYIGVIIRICVVANIILKISIRRH